jgi:hypothetical protein
LSKNTFGASEANALICLFDIVDGHYPVVKNLKLLADVDPELGDLADFYWNGSKAATVAAS